MDIIESVETHSSQWPHERHKIHLRTKDHTIRMKTESDTSLRICLFFHVLCHFKRMFSYRKL